MSEFDPRVTPARADLAASHLRGKVEAGRFVDGVVQEVIVGHTPVRKAPSHGATMLTEALRGERVLVLETDEEGWAWGQLLADGYVGWLPGAALLPPGPEPTHRVRAIRTFVFPAPDIKSPPQDALPLGARLAIMHVEEPFAASANGFLPVRHLVSIDARESDAVAVAERFLGAPYLWGGKTSLGVDCSGLVQAALTACGIPCPRDSDMQERSLGAPVDSADLQRGDLVFWKGHVAMARDRATLIHANAHHMAVVIEPISEAIARIHASGSDVTSVQRIG